MRQYELVVVSRSGLSETDRKKLLDSIKSLLKDFKITKEEDWGSKPLAYKIKREVSGFYQMLQVEGEKGVTPDFENRLAKNDEILRFLMIRKD